jgi:hypothetical protein
MRAQVATATIEGGPLARVWRFYTLIGDFRAAIGISGDNHE